MRTEDEETAEEWANALQQFERTEEMEMQFSEKLLNTILGMLNSDNLAEIFGNIENDPLRPAYILFGKSIARSKFALLKIRRLLNKSVIKTFRSFLADRWDASFDFAMRAILNLWSTILEETLPLKAGSRPSFKELRITIDGAVSGSTRNSAA
mmetsp:Transcript_4902/g.7260  ORF Transcript_4902/g.7260 Transcript_4902/m.7260 type:complete len:153 (+) Transcript_4902:112-570(+)